MSVCSIHAKLRMCLNASMFACMHLCSAHATFQEMQVRACMRACVCMQPFRSASACLDLRMH